MNCCSPFCSGAPIDPNDQNFQAYTERQKTPGITGHVKQAADRERKVENCALKVFEKSLSHDVAALREQRRTVHVDPYAGLAYQGIQLTPPLLSLGQEGFAAGDKAVYLESDSLSTTPKDGGLPLDIERISFSLDGNAFPKV